MIYLSIYFLLFVGYIPFAIFVLYYVAIKPLLGLIMNSHENTATGVRQFRSEVLSEIRYFHRRHFFLTVWFFGLLIFNIAITPIKNPFANEMVKIRGRFPFDKGFDLVFYESIYGRAPWYRRLCSGINAAEASCSGSIKKIIPTKIDQQYYEVVYYKDSYFSWFADWDSPSFGVGHFEKKSSDDKQIEGLGVPGKVDQNQLCKFSKDVNKGHLSCVQFSNHKDYKNLKISEGMPVASNEWLINFWLESEIYNLRNEEK